MSQFEGTGITNHVALRDEKAYAEFKTLVELCGGTLGEESQRDGRRHVSARGHIEDGDFRLSVTVEELVESGYVSRHEDSELNALLPEHLAVAADPELNADEELSFEIDFLHEVFPLLAVGEALIFQRVGHEKRQSLNGWAAAVNWEGQRVEVSLDDIYKLANESFGAPVGRTSY